MPSIPTVPGSEQEIHTPGTAVKFDAGAMNARYRGQLAVAGAVQGLGDQLESLSADLQKVKQTRIAADADYRMRAAQQAFVKSTQGDENEGEWSERAQHMYAEVRDSIFQKHDVPPAMKPELDAQLKNWGQTLQIKAETMSAVQSVNRATLAVRSSYDEAARDGDAMGMAHAISLGRSSKLDPVEMDALEKGIPRQVALTAIENGLRTNPAGTHELLASGASLPVTDQNGKAIVPSKVFPQKELTALVNSARIQAATWQRTNFETLLQDASDPITGMVPDEAIKEKIDSGEINVKAGRALMQSQDRQLRAQEAAARAESTREAAEYAREDRNRYNELQSQIHDQIAWSSGPEQYASELIARAAEITDKAHRQDAINDIHRNLAAVKKTGETAAKPVEREIYAQLKQDREQGGVLVPMTQEDVPEKKHWFSANEPAQTRIEHIEGGLKSLTDPKSKTYLTDEDIKARFGEKMTRDKLMAAERSQAAMIEQKMTAFFKEKPTATYQEADDFRKKLEQPYVMAATKAALEKRMPVFITNREEFNALPKGATFLWNGRVGTKP